MRLSPICLRGFFALRTLSALSLALIAGMTLSGCGSLYYLFQAGQGQLALLSHARPIAEVIQDERTPPRVKALLGEIGSIKSFGESNGLKPTSNYQNYVKLNRSAAVWLISACEVLRFKSKEWVFPVVGSFPYLGWFDRKDAESYQRELQKEGWDVDLRGAAAYSTLGWFPDAVLSTMIPEGDEALGDLVNVVLHESVHATLYIRGQAFFNESIASFIADGLTRSFLEKARGVNSPELSAYREGEKRSTELQRKLYEAYQKLDQIYASSEPDSQKLQAKLALLTQLKKDLHFRREMNNATLIQHKTYNTGHEEFDKLLKACNSNWIRFLARLKKLGPESFSKPHLDDLGPVLGPLIESGC